MNTPIEILQKIGDEVIRLGPKGWARAVIIVERISELYSYELLYFDDMEREASIEDIGNIGFLFDDLRNISYNSKDEEFESARFTLTNSGVFNIDYKYD